MERRNTFLLVVVVLVTLACNVLIKPIATAKPIASVPPTINPESQALPTDITEPHLTMAATMTPEENSGGGTVVPGINTWCNNDFFPIAERAAWIYDVTIFPSDNTVGLQIQITDVLPDRVRLTKIYHSSGFRDVDIPSDLPDELFCLPNGLASPLSGPGGIFIPNEMPAGSTWQEAIGTDLEMTYTSLGVETLTVPAGTFDATKVKAVSSSKKDVTTFRWYVAGLGLVKTYVEEAINRRTEELALYIPPGR